MMNTDLCWSNSIVAICCNRKNEKQNIKTANTLLKIEKLLLNEDHISLAEKRGLRRYLSYPPGLNIRTFSQLSAKEVIFLVFYLNVLHTMVGCLSQNIYESCILSC